jgi:hypothetical protein
VAKITEGDGAEITVVDCTAVVWAAEAPDGTISSRPGTAGPSGENPRVL